MLPQRFSAIIVALFVLLISFATAGSSSAQAVAPSHAPALPSAAEQTPSTPVAKPVPPQSPIAMPSHPDGGNITTFSLPCWAVNNTICVGFNETAPLNVNVVPNAPYLNASYHNYPNLGVTLYFDIYSVYNLQKNWGGSGSGEYLGNDAYLYLNVTDVQWNGIPWFCACDDSTWHADAGANWAPSLFLYVNQTVSDMIVNPHAAPTSIFAHYRYTLVVTATGQGASGVTANNWPAGAYVTWSVQSVHYVGGNAFINSTQKNFGGLFSYYVAGAWYWSSGSCITGQPCYPNSPSATSANCPTDGQTILAAAFRCNLELSITPAGQPTIGDSVEVNLRLNGTAQNYTRATLGSSTNPGATLYLTSYYPNGTEYRTWSAGFVPYQHWPTISANLTIPSGFFAAAYASVIFHVVAYDGNEDPLTSQNFTEVVSPYGTFPPGTNFSYNANLTTSPTYIGNESQEGTLNGTFPGLPIGETLNVSIQSTNYTVSFESAWIVVYIKFAANGINQSYPESMTKINLQNYYYKLEALPAGTNVSFYVKIWDENQSSLDSHWYHFFVPTISEAPLSEGFFYVEVFDNATGTWVTGANVSIIGLAGAVTIKTETLAGIAYPNVTGHQFTPEFLPANETYTVIMHWDGFQAQGEPPNTSSLRVQFYLTHTMTLTKTLQSGPNWLVKQQKDILFFSLNIPSPPPTFSAIVPLSGQYLIGALGLIAAAGILVPIYFVWREQRKRAAAEEKRITL